MVLFTTIYASIVVVSFILISFRIIETRRKKKIALFDGKDKELGYLIRAQGNFFEYSVLFLIMSFLMELNNVPWYLMLLAGIFFFIGRGIHAYAFITGNDGNYRVLGMQFTIFTLFAMVGVALVYLLI